MPCKLKRRNFIQAAMAASAASLAGTRAQGFSLPRVFASGGDQSPRIPIVSPGCRASKVKVAKIYLGVAKAMWPTPLLDLDAEVKKYEAEFARMKRDFADVEFVCNELVSTAEQAKALKDKIASADGVLVVHLAMGVMGALNEILANKKPTMVFAAPYSGHEWASFGRLRNTPEGALMDCILSADVSQLAVAVRPFRAIHHLREAKILNVTARKPDAYHDTIKSKYGTEIIVMSREPVLKAYESISEADARAETRLWIKNATAVVEPSEEEIYRSCRLALAFHKLVEETGATMILVDCYGTMYRQLPAFPCIGLTRLDDMGLGGTCESDRASALTGILLQALTGKPGFVSDPTVDESKNSIILAHCRCATKMDGPDGKASPYKIRTIHERQEGAVTHVKMPNHRTVTQAILTGPGADLLLYFTGKVIGVPDVDRGCRSKIDVQVDGSVTKLWQNWGHGLHRQTVYADCVKDLERFCRFKGVKMVNEAV